MRKAWTALGAAVLASAAGCGTVMNLASRDPVVPFGGVRKDVEAIQSFRLSTQGGESGQGAVVIAAFAGAELCLSAIGDTLTLPLALWICNARDAEDGTCSRTCEPGASAGGAAESLRSDSQ